VSPGSAQEMRIEGEIHGGKLYICRPGAMQRRGYHLRRLSSSTRLQSYRVRAVVLFR